MINGAFERRCRIKHGRHKGRFTKCRKSKGRKSKKR